MSSAFLNPKTPIYFENDLNRLLSNNLNSNLRIQISRLLALDYIGRLQSKPEILSYSAGCINRISKYLKQQIVFNDDFGTAFSLFAVAISDANTEEKSENKEQQINVAIDALFKQSEESFSTAMEQRIRSILMKRLLASTDINSELSAMKANAKNILGGIIKVLHQHNSPTKKTEQAINLFLKNMIDKATLQQQDKALTKDLLAKAVITTIASTFVVTAILLGSSLLIPILIPAFGGAIEYSSNHILKRSNSNNFNNKANSDSRTNMNEPLVSIKKSQSLNKAQNKTLLSQIGATKSDGITPSAEIDQIIQRVEINNITPSAKTKSPRSKHTKKPTTRGKA